MAIKVYKDADRSKYIHFIINYVNMATKLARLSGEEVPVDLLMEMLKDASEVRLKRNQEQPLYVKMMGDEHNSIEDLKFRLLMSSKSHPKDLLNFVYEFERTYKDLIPNANPT